MDSILYIKAMEAYLPISLKRIALKQMQAVDSGLLTKDQAEELVKKQCRYSSKTREQLIEGLTRDFDREAKKAFQFFRLI